MPEFYTIFARKINKIPEFYMIFVRKIFSRIWGGGQVPPAPPVSYAYDKDVDKSVMSPLSKWLTYGVLRSTQHPTLRGTGNK